MELEVSIHKIPEKEIITKRHKSCRQLVELLHLVKPRFKRIVTSGGDLYRRCLAALHLSDNGITLRFVTFHTHFNVRH
jgi:hypothetical protein